MGDVARSQPLNQTWLRRPRTGTPLSLLRFSGVMFAVVYFGVVFHGLKVSYDFRRYSKLGRQTLLQKRGECMCLTYGCEARKQQVNFDHQPISGCSKSNAMILKVQFRADCIEVAADLSACLRIGIVQQTHCRTPYQAASRPKNVDGNGDGNQRIEWLPVRQQHQA